MPGVTFPIRSEIVRRVFFFFFCLFPVRLLAYVYVTWNCIIPVFVYDVCPDDEWASSPFDTIRSFIHYHHDSIQFFMYSKTLPAHTHSTFILFMCVVACCR